MGVKFKVDCDELNRIASQIGQSAEDFKGAYESINKQLNGLKSTWVGVDSNEFSKVIPNMDGDVKQVYDQFTSIKDKLYDATSRYSGAKSENISSFYSAFQTGEEKDMGSNDVKIQVEAVNSTINSITASMLTVSKSVQNIQSQIKRVDSYWEGSAKNGFSESISNLDYNLEAIDNNLNSLKKFLIQVAESYSLAEVSNKISNMDF